MTAPMHPGVTSGHTPPPAPADPMADMRRTFARATRNTPIPLLTSMIAQACRAGDGHWQDPAPGGPIGRPATHLFEIQLYGQTASGTTPEEAANNWRTCALKQIEGDT